MGLGIATFIYIGSTTCSRCGRMGGKAVNQMATCAQTPTRGPGS